MATITDLKTELITQFGNVLAVAKINNLNETKNGGVLLYEIAVNSNETGRDTIVIRDNANTLDSERYVIYMRLASQQLTKDKDIITTAILTAGEFATMAGNFTTALEAFRDQIYTDSISMVTSIATGMVTRLS